jgi:hypothetical protein
MSANNGVIRVGRKGLKKFAFGDDGQPFEVDVVVAFQEWISIDDSFRQVEPDTDGNRPIPVERMPEYHDAAVNFVERLANKAWSEGADTPPPVVELTKAEALDFIARLRECYDDLAVFFRPRLPEERGSPGTSAAGSSDTSAKTEMRFSMEPN